MHLFDAPIIEFFDVIGVSELEMIGCFDRFD